MAEGIQYDVFASLKVQGGASFVADMDKAAGGADSLDEALGRAQGGAERFGKGLAGIGGIATDVMGKVVAFGTAATLAVAGGSAYAAMEVGKNLAMLESKSIQLTSVVAAATEQSFGDVRGETAKLFQQFKSDAVVSAGETENFIDTASKIAGPLLGAGKSMTDLREITKGVIATAPALGVAFEQAGSDVMRMLQGGAGADLPFFQALQSIPSLGIKSAEAFNKMDIDKRIGLIRKALTNPAFLAASDVAGDSFAGLTSTTQDLLKTMGGLVVSPAFEVTKRGLKGLTTTLMEGLADGGKLRTSLSWLGDTLGVRFEQFQSQLARIFPNLNGSLSDTVDWVNLLADRGLAKVVSATGWVADHWPEITSTAREFATWISDAASSAIHLVRTLGGGDLAKGVERAALLYGGSKVAAPAWAMASGGAQMAQGAAKAGQWAWGALGMGGAATAAAGAAEAGAAGAAAGAAGGGAAASGTAAAAGAAAGPVALIAAAVGGVLLGAYKVITDSPYWSFGEYISSKLSDAGHEFGKFKMAFGDLTNRMGTLWEAIKRLGTAFSPFLELMLNLYPPVLLLVGAWTLFTAALDPAAQALTTLTQGLQTVTSYLTFFTNGVTSFIDAIADKLHIRKKQLEVVDENLMREDFGVQPDARFAAPMISSSGALSPGSSTSKKPPDKSKQQVEVTIKWDLGEGDQDALFVRTRRDVVKMVQESKSRVVSLPPFRSR